MTKVMDVRCGVSGLSGAMIELLNADDNKIEMVPPVFDFFSYEEQVLRMAKGLCLEDQLPPVKEEKVLSFHDLLALEKAEAKRKRKAQKRLKDAKH